MESCVSTDWYELIGFERIAKNVKVLVQPIVFSYSLFQRTGNVDSAPSKERVELRQLDERAELYIIRLVLENPKSVPWRDVS